MQEQVLRVKLRILDAPKRQPVRGSGVAGIFAARAFKRVTEFGDVVIALPDAEHGADHDANHVVKKPVAANPKRYQIPVSLKTDAFNCSHFVLNGRARRAKSGKIVRSDKCGTFRV